MADPLSIIASVVGVVGFGIQVAQILQKEVDDITTAKERVEQIVIEIRATATGLNNLKDFLIEDTDDRDNATFNQEGLFEVSYIIRHCNIVLRNVTVLVAKAGNGVLSQVDLFLRRIEEEHKKLGKAAEPDVKLEIELSNLDHLMWPWRIPKIQQYLADMDRLKLSLVLILSVANLAKSKKQKAIKAQNYAAANEAESDKWEGSDAETLVQDEIFYQDQGLREAEEKLKTLTVGPSAPSAPARSKQQAAELLLQCWPTSPSGRGLCSIAELHDAGVILETFVFDPRDLDHTIVMMPLNLHIVQEHALRRRHWFSKKPCSVWDRLMDLPTAYQEEILDFVRKRTNHLYGSAPQGAWPCSLLVLVSLHLDKNRWQRLLIEGRQTLSIVLARINGGSNSGWEAVESGPTSSDYDGSDSYVSDSDSDSYPRRRSRSRYRRRSGSSRSRSRSRSPGRGLVSRFASRLGARLAERAYKKRSRNRRRSRSRSRSYYRDDYTPYGRTIDAGLIEYGATPYSPPPPKRAETTFSANGVQSPPKRAETWKTSQGNDTGELRRVQTLNDEGERTVTSVLENPPAQKVAHEKDTSDEPVVGFPPPKRRTTTFNLEADAAESGLVGFRPLGPKSRRTQTGISSQVPGAKDMRRVTSRERSRSKERSRNEPKIPYDDYDGRIRRSRSSSRSKKRFQFPMIRRRRTDRSRSRSRSRKQPINEVTNRSRARRTRSRSRSRSRSGYYDDDHGGRPSRSRYYEDENVERPSRRSRRSRREPSGIQLLTSSPTRPVIRTFEEDGVPPTQRDKAAVAEYYLKKWTTAYNVASVASRSRSKPQRTNTGYGNLIQYGDEPIYSGQDATAGASNPYGYYPNSNQFLPPPGQDPYGSRHPQAGVPGEYPPETSYIPSPPAPTYGSPASDKFSDPPKRQLAPSTESRALKDILGVPSQSERPSKGIRSDTESTGVSPTAFLEKARGLGTEAQVADSEESEMQASHDRMDRMRGEREAPRPRTGEGHATAERAEKAEQESGFLEASGSNRRARADSVSDVGNDM